MGHEQKEKWLVHKARKAQKGKAPGSQRNILNIPVEQTTSALSSTSPLKGNSTLVRKKFPGSLWLMMKSPSKLLLSTPWTPSTVTWCSSSRGGGNCCKPPRPPFFSACIASCSTNCLGTTASTPELVTLAPTCSPPLKTSKALSSPSIPQLVLSTALSVPLYFSTRSWYLCSTLTKCSSSSFCATKSSNLQGQSREEQKKKLLVISYVHGSTAQSDWQEF